MRYNYFIIMFHAQRLQNDIPTFIIIFLAN
nr:MAG TPA: hypothetical protein [Caudoviricetes sp.]